MAGQGSTEPGRSTRACLATASGSVGYAELVRLLAVGVPEALAARLAGLERGGDDARVGAAEGRPESRFEGAERRAEPPAPTAKPPTAEPEASTPTLWYSSGPEVTAVESVPRGELPAAFRDADACTPNELCRRSIRLPRPAPLIPETRLGLVLRRLLLVTAQGRAVDDRRLVSRLCRVLPLSSVPRKRRGRWPARIQLFWDQASALAPVREDQFRVASRLRRWRSARELEEVTVSDSGELTWHQRRRRGRGSATQPRPLKPPDSATVCLALSDLGCATPQSSRQGWWLRLGRELTGAGGRCVALVPYPPSRWDRRVTSPWQAVAWERATALARPALASRLPTATGATSPAELPRAERAHALLMALAPAGRVDWALLRAMRHALGRRALDVGTEFDVWLDESRVTGRDSGGFSWIPERRHEFRHELEKPEHAEVQKTCHEVLKQLRGDEGLLVRAEELLATGEAAAKEEALSLLRSYVKLRARDRKFLDPVEEGFLLRIEARLDVGDWSYDEVAALWALGHRQGQSFDTDPPPGLDASRVLWTLDSLPVPTTYSVEQQGTELVVRPVHGAPTPFAVLTLSLRWPRLEVEAFAGDELMGTRTLELGATVALSQRGADPAPTRWCLRGDYGLVEAGLEQIRLPDWASRLRRDREGLWVGVDLVEFDWIPAKSSGTPAVERIDRMVRELRLPWGAWPPPWAASLGRDAFGIVATLRLSDTLTTRLRWIPPGRYLMGSPKSEQGRGGDEGPQHWVRLSQGFWLGEGPCTQAEWEAVMGKNPSYFEGKRGAGPTGRRPVEQVSWEDCVRFCERLNQRHPGLGARLPREAEWEHACRAGTESAYNDGSACTDPGGKDPALLGLGWFDENSEERTHTVKELAPNRWGLYDLHGNVWEWCSDWYGVYGKGEQVDPRGPAEGQVRVVRGGGWDGSAGDCRSARRFSYSPGLRYDFLGFRLLAGQPGEPSKSSQPGAEPGGEPSSGRGATRSGAERPRRGPAGQGRREQ
jgi:formylglycine-generating enzyme required for sulfatase activity